MQVVLSAAVEHLLRLLLLLALQLDPVRSCQPRFVKTAVWFCRRLYYWLFALRLEAERLHDWHQQELHLKLRGSAHCVEE